jgi:MoaA/NifB/PqqE/SkfB family radical SAM enzyme
MIVPSSLNILTTQKCNAKCNFCEFSCKKEGPFIKEDLFYKIISESQEIGVERIIFDGGEFLYHPKAENIIRFMGKVGAHGYLLTNGLLFSRYAKILLENNIKEVVFGIDSFNPATNDRIKGVKGITLAAIKGIEEARKLGFKVGLHIVLSAQNVADFPKYLEFAASIQATPLMVSSVNLTGRGLENEKELALSSLQKRFVRGAYRHYFHYFRGASGFFAYRNDSPPQETMEQYRKSVRGCKYFSGNTLAVDWNGSVPFCAMEPSLESDSKFPKFSIEEHGLKGAIIQRENLKKKMEQKIEKKKNERLLNGEHNCYACYGYFKEGV